MNQPHQDDDFASMLKRVRDASGTKQGVEERPMPSQRPKSERPRRSLTTGGMIAILVLVMLGVVGLASLSTWLARRVVNQAAARDVPWLRWREQQQRPLRRFMVPVDSTISPVEAGALLHAIARTGFGDSLAKWERTPSQRFDAPACCTEALQAVERDLFPERGSWHTNAFALARNGFTSRQRAYLSEVSRSSSLNAMRRVAHARTADIGAAMWDVPADSQVAWVDLPTLSLRGLRQPIQATIAAAALDLAAGRAADAELRLKEVMSIGFLMSDAVRSTRDQTASSWVLNMGRASLEALYRATGRASLADQLANHPANNPYTNTQRVGDSLEAVLRRRMLDTTELLGLRWELLLGPVAYMPCTSVWTALFGPSSRQRAMMDDVRKSLVNYPSDERRSTMYVRGVFQLIDPATGFRARSADAPPWADFARTIFRSRQLEQCATLFRR